MLLSSLRTVTSAGWLLAASLLVPAASEALVIHGESSAYGAFVALDSLLVDVSIAPLAQAQGSSPAPYADSQTLLNAAVAGVLTAEALDSTADSDVDGQPGAHFADASATIVGADLLITFGLIPAELLSLGSTTIASEAAVSGDQGALVAVGDTLIEGLSLSFLGVGDVAVIADPAPNTLLVDVPGLQVVLNEQILAGDGVNDLSLTVNAIHVIFGAFGVPGAVLDGDIVVGSSYAALAAVPEPTTAMMMVSGLIGLAAVRRRRR